jgi:hypothetical protein
MWLCYSLCIKYFTFIYHYHFHFVIVALYLSKYVRMYLMYVYIIYLMHAYDVYVKVNQAKGVEGGIFVDFLMLARDEDLEMS